MDCKLPPMAAQLLCVDHKPKPLTLRERIENGPKFDAMMGGPCIACGEDEIGAERDSSTRLCRPCWRSWRWSMIREYEQP